MKMRILYFGFIAVLLNLTIVSVFAQSGNRSYYVRSNGNDENNGRSEDSSFATLEKAFEMASKGVIKTITVIGILNRVSRVSNTGTSEVILMGKLNSTDSEMAILSGEGKHEDVLVITQGGPVRIENIQISGGQYSNNRGLVIREANVTLGIGAVISNNNGGGVRLDRANLTLCENASICDNSGAGYGGGGGIRIESGTLILLDNASISNNTTPDDGGGIFIGWNDGDSYVIMKGDSRINANQAGGDGGGICIERADYGNRASPYIIMEDNAVISNNRTGRNGGGIYFRYGTNFRNRIRDYNEPLLLKGNASIENNEAKNGGGLYFTLYSINPITLLGGQISGNKAEYGAGIYYKGEKFGGDRLAAPYGETFILDGGNIFDNMADFVGGGIYFEKGSGLIQKKGNISDNIAGDGEGENIYKQ
jgi:hypothetical protein